MTRPNSVLDAVLTRRSAPRLTEPAPGSADLECLVQAAATAPDHGRLRPWRLVAVSGDERARLGDALAEAADAPEQARRVAAKPLRAPLLLAIVHRPVPDHPKVPEWEQLAATAGMVTTLSLLLHSHGFASIWRTGPTVQVPQVRKYDWHGGLFDVRLRVENPPVDALLSEGAPTEVLDFNGDLQTQQSTTTRLVITRPGLVDGVPTWLNLWCLPDEEPLDALRMQTNWATIYLPLFDRPWPVEPGNVLELTFAANLSDDRVHPDYQLRAVLHTADGQQHRGSLVSPHHGGAFRSHAIYWHLFPTG